MGLAVHPAAYNLVIALIPHLLLLVLIPCFLFELQIALVDSFVWKSVNSFILACVLYVLTQKSMRAFHSDKNIKQVTSTVPSDYVRQTMQQGDSLIDAILEKSFAQGIRRPLQYYNRESYKHIENTVEFQELQKQLQVIPSWIDHERIRKAYSFYRDNLTLILAGMAIGLVESYTYPSDAKVLEVNGGLVELKGTITRLSRTVQFVFDVIGGNELPVFGSKQFNHIVNIRFIHGYVRKFVKESPKWDGDFLPVNQFAQAGTLIFFCQTPIEVMKMRGISVSPEEAESCWQLWRYIGYLLGVQEKLLPKTYEHGLRLKYHPLVLERQIPNEASGKLALNTILALEADTKVPFHTPTFRVMLMDYIGEDMYKKLDLPMPTLFDKRHFDLMNFWWSHVRFCDHWSSFLRNWKNYFFMRYIINAGVIKDRTSKPSKKESFY